ncbi:DsrE family protein [Salinimonas iocasae]|uniref:Uncharacterized protein n=1 Tax=Salinimonas iocasae TaxID=2572577 RepID=A0A5B7YGY8_9ALTE|nr:DsrE family protein [Salinimonas iocasae]QCZ94533.1 hypothetical protein FBQ74_14120 [Salinimonas iocasae]
MLRLISVFAFFTAVLTTPVYGAAFTTGPVFDKFGKKADIAHAPLDEATSFKVAFDVASGAKPGTINRKFDSASRFINMHVANGVKQENIELVIVVHGSATLDLLNKDAYQQKKSASNANLPLLNALLDENVRLIVCGQSMAGHSLSAEQFIEGVSVSLSAMTAHALLQQQGYTLNPF